MERSKVVVLMLSGPIAESWLQLALASQDRPSVDIHIKLAYFLRHSGQLEKALDVTDVVHLTNRSVRISPAQRAILATNRAATLVDLYELRGDSELLKQARACLGIAWAIEKPEEASRVYQRLDRLEARVAEEEAPAKWDRSLRRVANPNDKRAHRRG